MKKYCLFGAMILCAVIAYGQQEIRFRIADAESKSGIGGVNLRLKPVLKNGVTDSAGRFTFGDLQPGTYHWEASHVGFTTRLGEIMLRENESRLIELELVPEEEEEEEVIIESTRSTRTIRDMPTRVEFVAGEELDEKANMKPGDIRMVLTESTGIQTQLTSATSGNSFIRIQGLDGRYTQVLKDGFPLYAGFSSGLGLLQTPPLDLKQFEVIKGSASTLYGSGAIAGLVNLISKTPDEDGELNFHFDATSAGGWNSSGFFGKKFGSAGLTLFASRNSNKPYDPAGIGLTAIPRFERYTLNPRLFLYFNDKIRVVAGLNLSTEDRTGGDIERVRGNNPGGFFERNNTDRLSTQFSFTYKPSEKGQFMLKNSLSRFTRNISAPSYVFKGKQDASFTELTYGRHSGKQEFIIGLNVVTDQFREGINTGRDYEQVVLGAFTQHTLRVNDKFHLETGLRGEQVLDYGFALLPRISALFRITPNLTSRVGGGMGYKTPTIFTEETERLLYRNVVAVSPDRNRLESSYGVNADINFKTKLAGGEIDFSINHLLFYTRIMHPLLLTDNGAEFILENSNGHFDSRGMETNVRLGYDDFKLFLGYTLTKAILHEGSSELENYLTPTHRINSVLLYEVEEKWKAGLEAYYFGKQLLRDGTEGRAYWITGFMLEKLWKKFSVYINFENFLDTRQTRFGSIYTGSISEPVFKDLYAPLDGFVVNGGLKLKLF